MDETTPPGPEKVDRELTEAQLVTGDRPSIFFFGMVGAHAIRKDKLAVFMVDVLGRIHLMPPEAVKVLARPRVPEEELAKLNTEEVILVLVAQGDSEEEIMKYLAKRGPQTEED